MAGIRRDNDVLHPVYAVTASLRWALLAHAVMVNIFRWREVAHPRALALGCAVMVLWTAVVNPLQARRSSRTTSVFVADFVVTLLLIAGSRWILGRTALIDSYLSVPVYWMAACPLVIAVWRGGFWGLASAIALSLAKFVQEPRTDNRVWLSMVVMGLAAWGLGAVVDTLRESIDEREAQHARTAALAERDRLNRIVHDGALQVLAMVEREGPELGPRGQQLAQMACAQELVLRRQLQSRDVVLPGQDEPRPQARRVDLATMLDAHSAERVTVSMAAEGVTMAVDRARELDAAVSEALVNVARHAGEEASAWVLLEADDQEVVVTVRDNGIGMSREQVHMASTTGRMGIHDSILGRIDDIGGRAVARSQPGRGVEWEFRVPMDAAGEQGQ